MSNTDSTWKNESGFTLVELMFVSAIIAILVAMALPLYTTFIVRSQAAEALELLGGSKSGVQSDIELEGAFPDNDGLDRLGIRRSGRYVATLGSDESNTRLIATYKIEGVSPNLQGKTVVFAYDESSELWACDGAAGTTDLKYQPRSCK